jgi:heme-degrading monooxygenase HmoA
LEYSTTPVRDEEAQQHQQKQLLPPPPPPPLVLTRRDGIDLYGRKIVHSDCDVRTATLSFLNATTTTTTKSPLPLLLLFEFDGQPSIWDATLVLRPDRNHQQQQRPSDQAKGPNAKKNTNNNICCCEDDDDERESPSMLLPLPLPLPLLLSTADWTSPFCFVAMNRFQVKEECKFLFEERWSQRQSKLSHQPGFLGFSLLRKSAAGAQSTQQQQQQQQQQDQHHRGTTIAKEETLDDEREHDRFNYSTCTVWDSIESWERWRNGVGKTSHEASKGDRGKQRVPVSEWLEGPSSPIFWDGQQSIEGVMDGTGQPNA